MHKNEFEGRAEGRRDFVPSGSVRTLATAIKSVTKTTSIGPIKPSLVQVMIDYLSTYLKYMTLLYNYTCTQKIIRS